MKIRYIGKSENYMDSIQGVGLTWSLGEQKDVTPALADKLMQFPDTWEVLRGDVLGKGASKGKTKADVAKEKDLIDVAPPPPLDTTMPVVNFGVMKREEIVEYMRRTYNVDMNPNQPLVELRQDALRDFTRMENELMDEKEETDRRDRERAEVEAEELAKKEEDRLKALEQVKPTKATKKA